MDNALKAVLDAAEPFARAWAMLSAWVNESVEMSIVRCAEQIFLDLMIINLRRLALAVEAYQSRKARKERTVLFVWTRNSEIVYLRKLPREDKPR